MKFSSIDLDVEELLEWERCIFEVCEWEQVETTEHTYMRVTLDPPVIKTDGSMVKEWKLTNVMNRHGRHDITLMFCSADKQTVRDRSCGKARPVCPRCRRAEGQPPGPS